jgi:acetoin utilization protein AcuC
LTVIWDDRFRAYNFGPLHPFDVYSRYLAARLLEAAPELPKDRVRWIRDVAVAERSELEMFHRARYLDLVQRLGALDENEPLDQGDTPSFPGCYEAAARIAGGTLEAARRLSEGDGSRFFQPAGGLHHAHPDRASGFCIFNDVALAITALQRWKGPSCKIAYIDIDAHHGDGVMYGFYESGSVLDIDFHQDGRTIFPGTGFPKESGKGDGAGAKVNLPLPPGAGDEAFIPLFRRIVPPLLREFRPDVIVLQHGVDAHAQDLLAQLQYTSRSYHFAVATVRELAHELCGDRIIVTGGGGYTPEHVALRLAEAGIALAEPGDLPGPAAPLPGPWRNEFNDRYPGTSPRSWDEPLVLERSPWRSEDEERLVHEISHHLGRNFPPVTA